MAGCYQSGIYLYGADGSWFEDEGAALATALLRSRRAKTRMEGAIRAPPSNVARRHLDWIKSYYDNGEDPLSHPIVAPAARS